MGFSLILPDAIHVRSHIAWQEIFRAAAAISAHGSTVRLFGAPLRAGLRLSFAGEMSD